MTTADFYVGLGDKAEWLGSVSVDGSPGEMDDRQLFGPARVGDYTEASFREFVTEICREANEADRGYLASDGDVWPWPYPTSAGTDMVYAIANNCVHVFERDPNGQQTRIAQHYPNGCRFPTRFPTMTRPKVTR